jgi:hypothetical protein
VFIIAESVEKKIKHREQIENCFSKTISEVNLVNKNKNQRNEHKKEWIVSPKLKDTSLQ